MIDNPAEDIRRYLDIYVVPDTIIPTVTACTMAGVIGTMHAADLHRSE